MTVTLLTEEDKVDSFYKYIADLSSGIGLDENGTVYSPDDSDGKVRWAYFSGMDYETHYGGLDLEGNGIDIVGNLK
jgi:hypothetical protein